MWKRLLAELLTTIVAEAISEAIKELDSKTYTKGQVK